MSIHSGLRWVWDPAKAKANEAAHGVTFAEAATVLGDDRAMTTENPDSIGERRFVTLGMSGKGQCLVVVYAWRGPATVRLISAWRANARQRRLYAQGSG
jgi:uncharacterized DUF497 family protein